MIEVKNLSKRFGETLAVSDVSFQIQKGEVVGLLGPNGAGKSTTMRMMCGFFVPDSGTARIGGYDIVDQAIECRRQIGYLPEDTPLYPEMNVIESLEYAAGLQGVKSSELPSAVSKVIGMCGLEKVLTKSIHQLSKGYHQRVGLAQAMIHDPEVLVLDEPSSGLDPNQIREIRELIREIGKQKTVILSTHILPEVEMTCGRVIIINEGKIVTDCKIEDIRTFAGGESVYYLTVRAPKEDFSNGLNGMITDGKITSYDCLGEMDDGLRFKLASVSKRHLGTELFTYVKDNGWTLSELRQEAMNLENVFSNLTLSDESKR